MANKVEVSFESTNSGHSHAILTGKRLIYPYENNKRTSDIPTATTISIAMHGNSFAPLNVKIEGSTDPLPDITDEDIKAACAAMKPYFVRFKGGIVSIYSINGEMCMTGTANSVELVTTSSK